MALFLILIFNSVYAASEKLIERLSWTPVEHLKKGYRTAPWFNDPFHPYKSSLALSGIISDQMALINGQWYRVGETVLGYKILSVKASGVQLEKKGDSLTLKVKD